MKEAIGSFCNSLVYLQLQTQLQEETVWPSGEGAEFDSRTDNQLDLFQLVPDSTPRLRLYKANWSASYQLGLTY